VIEQFLHNLLDQGLEKYEGDTEPALAWARTKLESFLQAQPEITEEMIEDYLQQMNQVAAEL